MEYSSRPDSSSVPKMFAYKLKDGLWIKNDENSLAYIFDVFKLRPLSLYIYKNSVPNEVHFNLLCKQEGEDSYILIESVYNPLVVSVKPKDKSMTRLERGAKTKSVHETDYDTYKKEDSLANVVLDGIRIFSVKSIDQNGQEDRLDVGKLSNLFSYTEENGMQNFFNNIGDFVLDSSGHEDAVSHMYA